MAPNSTSLYETRTLRSDRAVKNTSGDPLNPTNVVVGSLRAPVDNVKFIRLESAEIPHSWPTVHPNFLNNKLVINGAIDITIPSKYYNGTLLAAELVTVLNAGVPGSNWVITYDSDQNKLTWQETLLGGTLVLGDSECTYDLLGLGKTAAFTVGAVAAESPFPMDLNPVTQYRIQLNEYPCFDSTDDDSEFATFSFPVNTNYPERDIYSRDEGEANIIPLGENVINMLNWSIVIRDQLHRTIPFQGKNWWIKIGLAKHNYPAPSGYDNPLNY